ncbi:MAG: S8 family serine peptidase [Cytophagales bacterium]|nr:S8 family serine peptidase [Bernardetiaceae bacterium]MDW8210848.1 S8 family serine peptidase [Cytophagales bacterium]
MQLFKRSLLFFILAWHSIQSAAQEPVISKKADFLPNRLIVKFKPSPNFSFSNPIRRQILEKIGIEDLYQLHPASRRTTFGNYEIAFLYQAVLKGDVNLHQAIQAIQSQPEVAYVEPIPAHYEIFGSESFIPNDPFFNELLYPGRMYGYRLARVFEAWEITRGDSNTVIAIVDSGVRTDHPDLRRNLYYNHRERFGKPGIDDDKNGFVDDSLGVDFAENTNIYNNFHGTAVAGIAAAVPNNNFGFAGVGYHCRIMPLKVTRIGSLNPVGLYQALLYAAENGAKIINASLGQATAFLKWEQDIVNYITLQKDVLIVAAAGNRQGGGEIPFYPAAYENVLAVAASDRQDKRATNGVYGNHVALMAPGVDVWSTFTGPDFTSSLSGSSFATPFVAGAAGLVRSRYPHLKAIQIAALLRNTADDVYALPENAPYAYKLGRGRINVWRALQNQSTTAAIRATQIQWHARGTTGWASNDDTVEISAVFRNLLRPLTNARVTLTTQSRYARILEGSFTIGALASLDSVSNRQKPFLIYIPADTPPGETIHFRFNYTDGEYQDWQMFTLTTLPDPVSFEFNRISLSVSANGRMGMTDPLYLAGIGFRFDNQRILSEMGLMIGLSPTVVSNSVFVRPGERSAHFTPIRHPRLWERGLQHTVAYASFTDAINNFNRLNIKVEQTISARINQPHRQYIIIHYDITNNNPMGRYDSLRVGLYADWDIGNAPNRADWDSEGNFGYVYQPGGLWAGIKALGPATGYYAIDKEDTPPDQFNFTDDFNISEKFLTLSTGVKRPRAGMQSPQGADVAHVVTNIIPRLEPGEKQRVTFVIAVGNSLSDLRQSISQGVMQLHPATVRSATPSLPDYLCGGDTVRLAPGNGERFRFYSPDNLTQPIAEGAYLPLTMQDEGKIFLVSGYDHPIESPLVPYTVKIHTAVARFHSIDSLNIADSNKLYLFDKSVNPVSWRWEVIGTHLPVQTVQNPVFTFHRPGKYIIKLTITDTKGCQATATKIVKVVRLARGNRPVVPFIVYGCENSPILIAPATYNATHFNFYHDSLSTTAAFTGRRYLLTDKRVRKVIVTSIDSALESLPAEVEISRIRIKAAFTYEPRFDTVIYDRIKFTDQSISDLSITRWEWDFGDGSPKVFEPNPSYMYNRQGVFTVKLVVTNSYGCRDSVQHTFRVGRKAPRPIVRNIEACRGDTVVVRPAGGSKFNFYLQPYTAPVHTGASYRFVVGSFRHLWITSIDSIIESDPQVVEILIREAIADFEAPEEVGLGPDTPPLQFYDRSLGAVEWYWDFGDGTTSTRQNPAHRYRHPGIYRVRLQIRNILGCTSTITKPLRVVGQGPIPEWNPRRIFCPNEEILIAPQNGSKFRFYTTPPSLGRPVAEGVSWQLKLTQSQTIYITNADSLRESLPLEVRLEVSPLHGRFSVRGKNNRLVAGDTILLQAESQVAMSWQWNLGNGRTATTPQVAVVYNRAGVYQVTLSVRDEVGCIQTHSQWLNVEAPSGVSPQPSRQEPIITIVPNPVTTKALVKIDLNEFQQLELALYDHLGRLIWTGAAELQNGVVELPLTHLAAGSYLLRVHSHDLTRHIRLIKE